MAHRKAGGTAKNLRDSNPKFLGVKLFHGQPARAGSIIIRQRGTKFSPGQNVILGKDHTLMAAADGLVYFHRRRRTHFDGKDRLAKIVSVRPSAAV